MEASSSDEFDQLSVNLPKYPKRRISTSDSSQAPQEYDDFVAWQLNRFNRSSTISIVDLITNDAGIAKKNCKKLCYFLPIFQIIIIFFAKFNYGLLSIISYVLLSSVCMATASSSMYNENISSKIKSLWSINGIFSIILCFTRTVLIMVTVKALKRRQTFTIFSILLYFIISYSFFFQSCFIFEGRGLSFTTMTSYSMRLMFRSLSPLQGIEIFITFSILSLLGFFTFGFTTWLAYALKNSVFLALSGSAASSSTSRPQV